MFDKLFKKYNEAKTYYNRFSTHFHFLTSLSYFFMFYLFLRDLGVPLHLALLLGIIGNVAAILIAINMGKYMDVKSGNYKQEIVTNWCLSPSRSLVASNAAMSAMFRFLLKETDLNQYESFFVSFYDSPESIIDYFDNELDLIKDIHNYEAKK